MDISYFPLPFSARPIGQQSAIVFSPFCDDISHMANVQLLALQACKGTRPIREHALAVSRTLKLPLPIAHDAVQLLVVSGWLRPVRSVDSRVSSELPILASISALAVVTADRPHILERCLDTYCQHFRHTGRRVRVVVVDGSRNLAAAEFNRCVVKRACAGFQAEYVGTHERQTFLRAMVGAGIDREAISFGIDPVKQHPFTAGANRNLLLLLTAGERVLCVDDDTICTVWSDGEPSEPLRASGHEDPCDMQFFHSRQSAVSVPVISADLMRSHESLLGVDLTDVFASATAASFVEACSHLTAFTFHPKIAGHVRLTFSGIAGDAAQHSPYQRLFCTGKTREFLASNRHTFELALRSREVRRSVTSSCVAHGGPCLTYCTGIDNRYVMPPFIPFGSNEDGVFGETLGIVEPGAFFAHIPYGIVHDSVRPANYDDSARDSMLTLRLCDLVIPALNMFPVPSNDSSAALVRLGGHLLDLSRMDRRDFRHLMIGLGSQRMISPFVWFERQRCVFEYPADWRALVERLGQTLAERFTTPGYFIPVELSTGSVGDHAYDDLQHFFSDYGSLMRAWPSIWSAARDLNLKD